VPDVLQLKKTPDVIDAIEKIMKHDVAGDPMSSLRWTRKTRLKVAQQLTKAGIPIGKTTVGVLLKKMDFSLRVNRKMLCSGNQTPEKRRMRNMQFGYIRRMREQFSAQAYPVISVDTKKKENIGNFKNAGAAWERKSRPVNDHDFASDASGKAIPYGLYDVTMNAGFVTVGTSHDTAEFAVDSIENWWQQTGKSNYKNAKQLLILADSGGSNAARSTLWKYYLQKKICNPLKLSVTVCHYPTGASKWNPIEHRLFGPISKNWEGIPLKTLETVLKYIRRTTTETGLKVKALLNRTNYETKQKLTEDQANEVNVQYHNKLPKWNYTIKPKM
jgi:hypothetical protein